VLRCCNAAAVGSPADTAVLLVLFGRMVAGWLGCGLLLNEQYGAPAAACVGVVAVSAEGAEG
jgi:hypothetical protein